MRCVNTAYGVMHSLPHQINHENRRMTITLKESLNCTVLSVLMQCVLFCLLAGCTTVDPTVAELQRLQGTWEGVTAGDEVTITITGNSFHFYRDTNFWFETTITLPAGTDPKQLYATIKDCPPPQGDSIGKVVGAIFKIEDGTLTLATGGAGSSPEGTPKNFEATEDKGQSRYELRKVQPPKKNTQPPKANEPEMPNHAQPQARPSRSDWSPPSFLGR